jgi:hypothetical protein
VGVILVVASSVSHAADLVTSPTCDQLGSQYASRTFEQPETRPTLWWVVTDPPCPEGTKLGGAAPPDGRDLWCEDGKGRKTGPRTTFHPNGWVHTESLFDRGREIGPRLEWDDEQDAVARIWRFDEKGALHGETVEWSTSGATTVTTFVRGQKEGATWRLDETNQLLLVELWQRGERHGRSCTWRDGKVEIDQMWDSGEPASGA